MRVGRLRKGAGSGDNQRLPDTFYVQNFGCRASQADGAALHAGLAADGLRPVETRSAADLVVLNTCTVTASADYDVRQTIRRVHRENPSARILVTGCYAQRAPQELADLPGVQWVVGNSHKAQIVNIVDAAAPYHGRVLVGDIATQRDLLTFPILEAGADRARPNLKIQDGCHNRCSFCVIPFVRGGNRFTPADQVVQQVQSMTARYREVVLTGINLGRWGRTAGSEMRLADLLRRLLAETGDSPPAHQFGRARWTFRRRLLELMAEIAYAHHSTCTHRCSRARTRFFGRCTASIGRGITPTA